MLSAFAVADRAARHVPFGVRLLRRLALGWPRPGVQARIGPLRLTLDARDYYQAAMAVDRYEPETVALVRHILRPGDTYVDVGAHVGYLAAHAAERIGPAGRMLLFEPDPRPLACLRAAVEGSPGAGLPDTTIIAQACSDRRGELTLVLAPVVGQSSLLPGAEQTTQPAVRVTTTKLDDELAQRGVDRVRFLKIDAEGHEPCVLRGARRSLESGCVDWIIIEHHRHFLERAGYTPLHLHALLTRWGYAGAKPDGRPLTRERILRTHLENHLYARSPDGLRELFPAFTPEPIENVFAPRERERLAAEAVDPDYPGTQIHRILEEARTGRLEPALGEARALLERRPELLALRGHYAHLLARAGRAEHAAEQLRRILEQNPKDAQARQALDRLQTSAPRPHSDG